jgi:hypothetical protein
MIMTTWSVICNSHWLQWFSNTRAVISGERAQELPQDTGDRFKVVIAIPPLLNSHNLDRQAVYMRTRIEYILKEFYWQCLS